MTLEIKFPDSVKLDEQTTINYRAFLQAMANRRVVGAMRYGDIPQRRQKYLSRLIRELAHYRQTGNSEHLINVANYCFLEVEAPQLRHAHFDNTAKSATRRED